jgi:integrase
MSKLIKSNKDPELYYYYNAKNEKLWAFRHRYYDSLGKRKEKKKRSFKTEKEAYRALLEVKAATINGEIKQVDYSNISIGNWFETWYETHQNEWSVSTRTQREVFIRKQLKPLLGHYKLQKLDKTTYKRVFINELLMIGYKKATVELFHRLFKIGINAAVDDEILSRNRFTKITISNKDTDPEENIGDNFLIARDLNILLEAGKKYENITNFSLLQLLSYTGLRRGEGCGLKWNDINFEEKKLTVVRTRDNKGARPPKTKNSYRTILIDDTVIEQLKRYRKWCKETLLSFGKHLKDDDFIFISYQTGNPITDGTILYALRRLLNKTALKYITPHGLRHTHATILIGKGVNAKVIAERLGNTPAMIWDIYGHVFEELEEESVSLFSESLMEVGTNTGANS